MKAILLTDRESGNAILIARPFHAEHREKGAKIFFAESNTNFDTESYYVKETVEEIANMIEATTNRYNEKKE